MTAARAGGPAALERFKDRMARGEMYDASDPLLEPHRLRCLDLLDAFNRTALRDFPAREAILRRLLARVGPGGWVMPRFLCEFGFFIELGPRVRINYDAVLLDCAPIVIGADVWIGPRCQLYTANHPFDPELRGALREQARPIELGDSVWLGGGTIVLPGVSIGAGAVVGAGSVVTRDLPPSVVAAGNPARVIRPLP
ncbi:sugar O-acetyltransferase [Streptomyces sp. NPDC001985]|uniref:sugar O-acetyltransferase n=1 Tax=Streptomyces sp. NPDC001985 TaxID=3154406 RepID=UPI003332C5D7